MPSKRRGSSGLPDRNGAEVLDETDRKLLGMLVEDPRAPTARFATRLAMSRPAVAQRLRRLERAHVIDRWRVDLNPSSLGLSYTVFFRVRPAAAQVEAIENIARSEPAVVECYRLTGEDALLLKAHFATVPEFERFQARLNRHGQSVACDVLSAVVAPRAPNLTRAASSPVP